MMDVEKRLEELGYSLPVAPEESGNYISLKEFCGSLVYVSGTGGDSPTFSMTGTVGKDLTIEQGYQAAAACVLNILAAFKQKYGSLNRIKSFVKLLVFVDSSSDFYLQPKVANGASDLLVQLFGESVGKPARSAIGVSVLPDHIPVEIECIIELNEP